METQTPKLMYHFYVPLNDKHEICYNVGSEGMLTEMEKLDLGIFLKIKPTDKVFEESQLQGEVVEIGTRPQRITSFSHQGVDLLHDCGLKKIFRIETSSRTVVDQKEDHINENCDPTTQCVYPKEGLATFEVEKKPDPLIIVPMVGDVSLIRDANVIYRMGMDEKDIMHFHRVFNGVLKRDATEAEVNAIREWISDHSRHRTFNAKISIKGEMQESTLMELVKKPYELNPGNCVIAFHDNASAIYGDEAILFTPDRPGWPTTFVEKKVLVHPTITVETHCFPTAVSPGPGAETGAGGDNRDSDAPGKGGTHLHSITGFSMGDMWIPGDTLSWEMTSPEFTSKSFASPLKIGLDAPFGAFDYQNKYGVPTLQGFYRTFSMVMPNGEHYAYWKPIMMAGMAGYLLDIHKEKDDAEPGMLICAIGGDAQDVGFGGGSGSSGGTDEKNSDIDFNAVQRACAGTGHITWRVIRLLIEMGLLNPFRSIHDQGAAGLINVLTELIEKAGGKVYINRVKIGDKTMIVLKILLCEYQERYGFLINPKDLPLLQHVCEREGCNFEVLGEVTGDKRIVFYDETTDTTHIDLPIDEILKDLPQRVIDDIAPAYLGSPIKLPEDITLDDALYRVLRLPAVACKDHLVNRTDRSIMALQARGQACGPLSLPLSDFALSSIDYEGSFGVATAIGEQPSKMMLNPRAGARMTDAEMHLNMSSIKFKNLADVRASVNWMWPAKGIPGGVAKLYYAMKALTDFQIELHNSGLGGKDSSGLFLTVGGKIVKSPETLVLTGLAKIDDISKYVTPDIKKPGRSKLMLIDSSDGSRRLGGSAFLQVYNQIGDVCPDVDAKTLSKAINAEQEMIDRGLILSSHDTTGDGGLIVCILEMLFAGDCGANVEVMGNDLFASLFAEEAGKVIEYEAKNELAILKILDRLNVRYHYLGKTTKKKTITLYHNFEQMPVYVKSIVELRQIWRKTSYMIERLRTDLDCAEAEYENLKEPKHPPYKLTFRPKATSSRAIKRRHKPKVAVIRAKVTTGDREVTKALKETGHDPYDIHLSDLKSGRANLSQFQGIAIAPGFSYEDVFGAGKGVAFQLMHDPRIGPQLAEFRARSDTWFWGTCNGTQSGAWMGMAPFSELDYSKQPLFLRNKSGRFESRFVSLKINGGPSIMFKGMEETIFGSWVAHGEGQVWLPDMSWVSWIEENKLVTMVYVDDEGKPTTKYPFNPNGSINGWAGLCDLSGRFNIMMPHPIDRGFKLWQLPWVPPKYRHLRFSPWLQPLQNLCDWSIANR